jgi:heat shock protein HslJ
MTAAFLMRPAVALVILGAGITGCTSTSLRPRPGVVAVVPDTIAATPWEQARLRGAEFRAVGQEPGWSLELDQDGQVRFAGDYGRTRLAGATQEPTRDDAGAITFRAQPEGRDLTVVIRETPCRDTMSGESFSHSVTVRLDGGEMTGCGRTLSTGELTGKYWKLVELNGSPAVVGAAREAHLRLFAHDSRVAGSTGCNSLTGQFERTADRVRFGHMATTRMACVDPSLARQEQDFVRTLETVDRFTVQGDAMTLYANDRPVARFAAVYLR